MEDSWLKVLCKGTFFKKDLLNLDQCYGCFHLGCKSSACSEHLIVYLYKLVENVEEALTPLQVGAFWYQEPWSKCPKKRLKYCE